MMTPEIMKQIYKDCKSKFGIRAIGNETIADRVFIRFHIMELMNTDKMDEFTAYLKSVAKSTGSVWSGWFNGEFEIIYTQE